MKKIAQSQKEANRGYTIGRNAFAKISAVEGIYLTKEMHEDFNAFDQSGLPHSDRREAIFNKYAR